MIRVCHDPRDTWEPPQSPGGPYRDVCEPGGPARHFTERQNPEEELQDADASGDAGDAGGGPWSPTRGFRGSIVVDGWLDG